MGGALLLFVLVGLPLGMLLLTNIPLIIRLRLGVRFGSLVIVGSIILVVISIEAGYLDLAVVFLFPIIIEFTLASLVRIQLKYVGPVWGLDVFQGDVAFEL